MTDAEGIVVTDTITNLVNNVVGAGGGIESITFDPMSAVNMVCTDTPAGSNGVTVTCTIDELPECSAGSCPTITIEAPAEIRALAKTQQPSSQKAPPIPVQATTARLFLIQ